MLGAIATVLVLCALAAPWYSVRVVGPNFEEANAVSVPDDPIMEPDTSDQELREVTGEWSLWKYEHWDETFDVPPPMYSDPIHVYSYAEADEEPVQPNANTNEVYKDTSAFVVAGTLAVAVAGFGAWNIARYNRWRMFTAASWFLAGILLLAGPAFLGSNLPDAMEADAATGHEDTYSLAFKPFINPENQPLAYYDDFSGGYRNDDPRASEQFEYGPASGWWLSGISAIMCLFVAALLFAAPQWKPLRFRRPATTEVRYVPVPVVTQPLERRAYPRRMPSYNPQSPGHQPPSRYGHVAQVRPRRQVRR